MGAGDEDDDDAEEDGMAANPISRLMTLISESNFGSSKIVCQSR